MLRGKVIAGEAAEGDVGSTRCPQCDTLLWDEGEVLECPVCQVWFCPADKVLYTSAERMLRSQGLDHLVDTPALAHPELTRRALRAVSLGSPCGSNEIELSGLGYLMGALQLAGEGRGREPIPTDYAPGRVTLRAEDGSDKLLATYASGGEECVLGYAPRRKDGRYDEEVRGLLMSKSKVPGSPSLQRCLARAALVGVRINKES
jgi:hypothetical protein